MANVDQNSSKSDKYSKAVARATGSADDTGSNAPAVQAPGTAGMIKQMSEADFARLLSDDTLEFAPQALSLEEGQCVEGILEGMGPEADVTDATTKEIKAVGTWVIRNGGARISLLTSAQLDRKLPPFIGEQVIIARGKELKTGSGRRVTDYMVAGKKKTDGSTRSFARLPSTTIDAESTEKADKPTLPSGSNVEQPS